MLGILGGTFDPIHFGHLRPALEAFEALELDELRLIPLRDPPHRDHPDSLPEHRLAMIERAIAGQPGFRVDDQELKREGKSFTLYTLRALREERGDDEPICLLLGTDAYAQFATWHRPDEIMDLAHLVVMQRPVDPIEAHYPQRMAENPAELHRSPAGRILFLPVTQLAIASTHIRALIREGRSPRWLLPDGVLAYIEQEGLYR